MSSAIDGHRERVAARRAAYFVCNHAFGDGHTSDRRAAQLGGVKATSQRLTQPARQRAEAALDERVRELFQRLPMLSGFAMADDLGVTEVAIDWPGHIASVELYAEIADHFVEVLEERPELVALVRGRTFARAFQ